MANRFHRNTGANHRFPYNGGRNLCQRNVLEAATKRADGSEYGASH